MPAQSLVKQLSPCTWGRTHEEFPDLQRSSTLAGRLGSLTLWDSLAAADLLLPPFRSCSTSTSSALESKTSQSIPSHVSLRLVSEDLEWIEDVQAFARQTWKDTEKPASQNRRWESVVQCLQSAPRFWRTLLVLDGEGSFGENSENDTDMRVRVEATYLDILFNLISPTAVDPEGGDDDNPATFVTTGQESTRVEEGGTVKTDINIKYRYNLHPPQWINLARVENKTALVQFAHARRLQRVVGKPRNCHWDAASTRIYTQAYTGSFLASTTIDELSASRVVILGNGCLWRIAYVIDGELVLSKWYSTNPSQAHVLLPDDAQIQVHQGHLLRQKLALTALDDVLSFVKSRPRSQPSTLDTVVDIAVHYMRIASDTFTRLQEILFRSSTADFTLSGPRIHARCIGAPKEFLEGIRMSPDFEAVKPGCLWTNGQWYIKIPSGTEEVLATREASLRAGRGVVQFAGELVITTGEHRGKILLATCAVGEAAGHVGDLLEENLNVAQKANVISTILAMHEAGWHHHDINPANVIVSGDGDDIRIIDFGQAQRASECLDSCKDADVMASLSISPSPSTGTAVDELAQSLTAIVDEELDRDVEQNK
ncbi:hypothetical protein MVEN_00411400 [Mycena venus]|uniref:Protein kinase domain-containing protein n=1 Tax=Mycena venus TaxID=2733690 RepID=A0A8H6YX01_9AGAR|nr:hypothetical protein MVEN_00411400 [Mycena venus]